MIFLRFWSHDSGGIQEMIGKALSLGSKFMRILHLFLPILAKNNQRNERYVSATAIKVMAAQEFNGQNMILLQWII